MRWKIKLPPRPESPGERLRALREARDLTQLDVAAETGLTQTSISAYERDAYFPKLTNLRQLATYYDVPITELRALRDLYQAWQEEFPRLPGPSLAIPDEPALLAALDALEGMTPAEMATIAGSLRSRETRPRQHQRPERADERPDRDDTRHAG